MTKRRRMSQQLGENVVSVHQRYMCVVACHFMPDEQYAGIFSVVHIGEGPPGKLSPTT